MKIRLDTKKIYLAMVERGINGTELANEIMRLVQEQFDNKMYISVQFQA